MTGPTAASPADLTAAIAGETRQGAQAVKSDFFSFCMGLRPAELKAIGELSHVKHLDEGVTIYSTGDESDSLYIINRGTVAVIHENPALSNPADLTYLTRGDLFGELETLIGGPRRNAIRSCEQVSLQCFLKTDFPALVERAPSFFHFLARRMARRLIQLTDVAFTHSNCLELSGNLANFDLVTVYQTILNSSQTGELAIFSERGEPVAKFFFRGGRPQYARYHNLDAEEAIFQLFLHERLPGTFSFSIRDQPAPTKPEPTPITRNATDLLITALQYRDEFGPLAASIPDPTTKLHRTRINLEWDLPELRPVADAVWLACYHRPLTIQDLFQRLCVCELRLYKVLSHLIHSGHIAPET